MNRGWWWRVAASAAAGAAAGATALVVVVSMRPQLALEMDRRVTAFTHGFYDVERAGELTFGWTRGEASLVLPGLDRTRPWSCDIRLSAGRPAPADLPQITVAVDGAAVATDQATNGWQDLRFAVPPRTGAPGAVITLTSSNTFQPGPHDARTLGVMVDRWTCAPVRSGIVRPPSQALVAAATSAAVFGAALALLGFAPLSLLAALCVVAVGQAIPLAWGLGAFSPYVARGPWLAIWIVSAAVAIGGAMTWRRGQRLSATARFVLAFSAAALYLKLLALLHPSKAEIDAVFHAHRLEWVLSGRFFFTQPMPSGVQFPYAIGLYVFAAPWSALTHDLVALLRIVVVSVEVVAGACLYPLVVRSGNDRLAAAAAVVLFNLVPISYWVIGNANLTNAFGQSVALIALVAATTWPLQPRAVVQWAGLSLIVSLALLSHVSTFALLVTTLLAAAILYRWKGGPPLRVPANALVVVTAVAVLLSIAIYYGNRQFIEVYQRLGRVRSAASIAPPSGPVTPGAGAPSQAAARDGTAERPQTPIAARVGSGLGLTVRAVGWPILLLSLAGLWTLRRRGHDRLTFLLAAWGIAYGAFLALAVLTRVSGPFERYAAEFVSRVAYATYPAVVVLAALGFARWWNAGVTTRAAAGIVAAWGVALGINLWLDWLR